MTTNNYRGAVSIELDQPRTIRMDFNALVLAEEKMGCKLDLANVMSGGYKSIRTLLWAGLIADDPNLTEEQVGAMVGPADFHRIAIAIATSMNGGNLPEAESAESKNAQGTEAGA
jgi:hypothetical protein